MQLADILAGGTQMAPSVLPPLGQMPGAPMPQLQMAQQMQAAPMAQQQAPVIDKSVPAQPQAPQAPQPQVPQQPQGNPEWAMRWQAIKQKLDDPTVMGPLQTFFGVLGAPLGPGENVGTRMARASMMMQSHRQMLQENQKAEETAAQDRQMKAEDRGLAREEKQLNIKRLGVENTAKEQGMAPDLAKKIQDLEKMRLEVENLPQKQLDEKLNAQSTRNYQSAMADKARREPTASATAQKEKVTKEAWLKNYDTLVERPLQRYLASHGPDQAHSWEGFLATKEGAAAQNIINQAQNLGIPMDTKLVYPAGATAGNIVTPSVDTIEAVRARVQKAKEAKK